MTTLNDLVQKVRRRTLSDMREEIDTLGASVGANATTLSLGAGQQLGSIRPGAIIEVDYELLLVTNAPNTSSIMVIPGYLDSTSTSHTAGALLTVNPRFPFRDIIDAINEDIDAYSSPSNGLFQMKEVTLTYNPVVVGYDMTGLTDSQVIEVWEVRNLDYGPAKAWPIMVPSKWKLQRNADVTQFPSGMALEMYDSGYPGRPLRVQFKSPYTTPLVSSTDDVLNVTGLHTQAHDIPVLGASVRLMEFRELKRSFTEAQGEPRRAQEVPVGSSLTAMKGIMADREKRIAEERSRLERRYPRQQR